MADENDDNYMSRMKKRIAEMAAQGRSPSFNQKGEVRGFRTRRGALPSPNEAMGSTSAASFFNKPGVIAPIGHPDHNKTWDLYFQKPSAPSATTAAAPVDYTQGEDTIAPLSAPTPDDPVSNLSAGVAGNSNWFRNKGIAFPPPPRSVAPSLMTPAPFMPGQQGAWRGASTPATSPMGNAATDQAGYAANRSLYAPGGGANLWRRPQAEQWQTPTSRTAADIWKKYGDRKKPASVSLYV